MLTWKDGKKVSYEPPIIGKFHQWSTAGEGGLDSSETYPVAIMETPDGSIETPAAVATRFVKPRNEGGTCDCPTDLGKTIFKCKNCAGEIKRT